MGCFMSDLTELQNIADLRGTLSTNKKLAASLIISSNPEKQTKGRKWLSMINKVDKQLKTEYSNILKRLNKAE